MCRKIVMIQLLLIVSMTISAQGKEVTRDEGLLQSKFIESEDGLRNGSYQLFYKDNLVEKGQYKNGEKVGKWQFYSFNKILDYEYDFDSKVITRIGGERITETSRFNTPCFFEGSQMVPYLFMVQNVFYPKKAIAEELTGRVVLTLQINEDGEIYGFYISEKLHSDLDQAVIKAARRIPKDWHFFPATHEGRALLSEYKIPIEFDLGL
ncbi:energy transducer TonB [Carboxylicivirga linearis]|uniref:Energy transducer TonB n=1 Tax=Carboxylicivirga linearis TaxID=1628157 RepID=A0ABS5JS92_9BACT|nr:energy transducer TonB [Carboxylicivirga linearis]MBS2097670.1 energy transducer TonB [Carboxylicivirga linearis]